MTRHELKEQVQHDQFTDTVSNAVSYASTHRDQLIRWAVVALAAVVVVAGVVWYMSYRNAQRDEDLAAAFEVLDMPVGPANPANPSAKTYDTQDAKTKASMKALSGVLAKDGGTRQGLTAQYYLGTLKAQSGEFKPGLRFVGEDRAGAVVCWRKQGVAGTGVAARADQQAEQPGFEGTSFHSVSALRRGNESARREEDSPVAEGSNAGSGSITRG